MDFDVFNGDADGICALIQLRLSDPRPDAQLVTGVKRDIKLLERVEARAGDRVTALDISMAKNQAPLRRMLDLGAEVFYADHHDPGDIPDYAKLTARIVTRGEMCTSVIIDTHLHGAHRDWAIVGAFGDNMNALAGRLAEGRDLPLHALKELGNLLNYNAYGASLDDLNYHPDALYTLLADFASPVDLIEADDEIISNLRQSFANDLRAAEAAEVLMSMDKSHAILMEDSASARRISGVYGNQLASQNPERAHAIITRRADVYVVSIRAPISTRKGAVDLANQFDTGGGRAAAAGINALPIDQLDRFLDAFRQAFG